MMFEIDQPALVNIQEQFPGIVDDIKEKMNTYFDDETCLRLRFLGNVPLFRGQDEETLYKMHYLTEEQYQYQFGDCILDQGCKSSKIMIVMEGSVQVRVSSWNDCGNKEEDLWLADLTRGSCFNVYAPFNHNSL